MSDKDTQSTQNEVNESMLGQRRGFFSRGGFPRLLLIVAGLFVLLILFTFVYIRFGFLDGYVKSNVVQSLEEIGIAFEAEKLRTRLSPLSLEIHQATFNDKLTGEKLFFIEDGKLALTAQNLVGFGGKRKFEINSTDLNGVHVWIKFDENGRSNFANLKLAREKEAKTELKISSAKLSLKDSFVHIDDRLHTISGEAGDVSLYLTPDETSTEELPRFVFDLTSLKSKFIYDEKPFEPVDLRVRGIGDQNGAQISSLKLVTPLGESSLTGNLKNWSSPVYDLDIESSVDLTQLATVLPNASTLRGVGAFKGKVTGEGEHYKIDGEITSDSLAAGNIRLKALQVNASGDGKGSAYELNGKAIAEMLTFEDFQIDSPMMSGNVRGTGTDFRWLGELRAVAAKSPEGTLAGLYISDAVAEYEDGKLSSNLGNVTAHNFFSKDAQASALSARNARLTIAGGTTDFSLPEIRAQSVNTETAKLGGVSASDVKLKSADGKTEIDTPNLRADSLATSDVELKNLSARDVKIDSQNGITSAIASRVEASEAKTREAKIGAIEAGGVALESNGNETRIYSDGVRVASIASDATELGTINLAGVRLSIREGRIEGTSPQIDAGDISLRENGRLEKVSGRQLVFVVEPSGRYRASMDMTLGGGVLGSVKLGAARAKVEANNDLVALKELAADVMEGKLNGEARIALNANSRSAIDARFENLDVSKILALQGGRVFPLEGKTFGEIKLNFPGRNFRSASGTLTASFNADAGSQESGLIPLNGKLGLGATNGLFEINYANLASDKSRLDASGSFDLEGTDSNLQLALRSSDGGEIERLLKALNVSAELEQQLNSNEIELAGNLTFDGKLTGNLLDPLVEGRASLESFAMHKRELGSIQTNLGISPTAIELTNGKLQERAGGFADFSVNIPRTGTNNISVEANLTRINTDGVLAALQIRNSLPEFLQDLNAEASGKISLSGLPNALEGFVALSSNNGTIAGQKVQSFESRLNIAQNVARIEKFDARFADGFLQAEGSYNFDSRVFDFGLRALNLQVAELLRSFVKDKDLPQITGVVDFTANVSGDAKDFSTYDLNFNGGGKNIAVDQNPVGAVTFVGKTENKLFEANLTTIIEGQEQLINGRLNFADENLPLRVETNFVKTELAPFIALFRKNDGETVVAGHATGKVFLEGNLNPLGADGKRALSADDLKGLAQFTDFGLSINETPFLATEPITIHFSTKEAVVDRVRFAGAGSNLVVSGTKALSDRGINDLSLDGKINLRVFDVLSHNTFFSGSADVSVRMTGANADARLGGSAQITNASIASFVGSERLTFERINGRAIFTTNQVQIENAVGYLGGGKVTGNGGGVLVGLRLDRFQLNLRGTNVTAPLPKNFVTTGDAQITITGRGVGNGDFDTLIAGEIFARRSLYTKDIDLADVVGTRRERSLSQGTTAPLFGIPKLDLRIEGRDALVVKNNLADLTASGSLNVTGDVDYPILSGRLTANSGSLFYRNDRYELQRGALEYPPLSTDEPTINLQATSLIKGYQVTVDLSGQLTDLDALTATVRSNPALPQADVVSLITTGSLTNTDTGIPTLAQTGLNTATELLTDALVNNPARRATDKLFGLNKFEIDPIISGRRLNPSARLTVGRQINNDLLVTYSTNIAEDQNQVLALEYRVSNRLSFIAQYEQRSLTNVTRNRNNFSFEIRLRKRF